MDVRAVRFKIFMGPDIPTPRSAISLTPRLHSLQLGLGHFIDQPDLGPLSPISRLPIGQRDGIARKKTRKQNRATIVIQRCFAREMDHRRFDHGCRSRCHRSNVRRPLDEPIIEKNEFSFKTTHLESAITSSRRNPSSNPRHFVLDEDHNGRDHLTVAHRDRRHISGSQRSNVAQKRR